MAERPTCARRTRAKRPATASGDAGPDARPAVVVHLDEHFARAVQCREDVAAVVGHDELADARQRAQAIADRARAAPATPSPVVAEIATDPRMRGQRGASRRRDRRGRSCSMRASARHVVRVDLAQHGVDRVDARLGVGRAPRRRRATAGRHRRPLRASTGTPRRAGAAGAARSRRCRRAARSHRREDAAGASSDRAWRTTGPRRARRRRVRRLSSVDLPAFV